MNKIYILSHKHKFEDGHEDKRIIGAFFSKKKALETLEKYKNIKGFKDNLYGFYIQEFIIDVLKERKLKEIKEKGNHE